MSPPRRHYGPKPPGRLQATMLKVVAAELTEPGRLGRGKRYFNDGAVTDIEINPGEAIAVVQGSRPDPYRVAIETTPGQGVPSRSQLWVRCGCPDEDNNQGVCKHGVAGLFALANEIAVEPEVLDVWRSTDGVNGESAHAAPIEQNLAPVIPLFGDRASTRPPTDTRTPTARGLRTDDDDDDIDADDDDTDADDADRQLEDWIDAMLSAPTNSAHRATTDFGPITPIEHPSSGDATVDRLLAELRDELQIDWD